jgi:hypothetical protein
MPQADSPQDVPEKVAWISVGAAEQNHVAALNDRIAAPMGFFCGSDNVQWFCQSRRIPPQAIHALQSERLDLLRL